MERNENDAIPEDNPKKWCSLAQCLENMFHYCLARSFYNNVEIYLQDLYKVNVKHRDSKGRTPLHYMCLDGRILVLKLLLVDHGIDTDVNAVDDNGRTPLHYACRNGHEECAVALLKLGADVSLKDKHGWTALDAARFNGRKELLDALRGNIRPGIMSPVNPKATPLSPSLKIKATDLKDNLPPEETPYGVQMDDVFIPSPALQRLRAAGTKIKNKTNGGFADVVSLARAQAQAQAQAQALARAQEMASSVSAPISPGGTQLKSLAQGLAEKKKLAAMSPPVPPT